MHFHEAYLKREKEQFYNHENLSTLLLFFSVFFTYQMIRFMECNLEYFFFNMSAIIEIQNFSKIECSPTQLIHSQMFCEGRKC